MSKGSGRRPQQVDDIHVAKEFERIFGKVQKDPNHLARQTMPHKDKKKEAKKRGEA